MSTRALSRAAGIALAIGLSTPERSLGNGGPFVVKYPNGDPAAKGIFARLDPTLKPGREERLRVVKEDLKITFVGNQPPTPNRQTNSPPLAVVLAAYTIENPTDGAIEIDFGFPILRGIYMSRLSMSMIPRPDVEVRLNDKQRVNTQIISNSAIYGLIRQRARDAIEQAIAAEPTLAGLVATVRTTGLVRQRARSTIRDAIGKDGALGAGVREDALLAGLATSTSGAREPDHEKARAALSTYLTNTMKWTGRDAALMVEYAGLDFGMLKTPPRDRPVWFWDHGHEYAKANLGALGAIGEQKAAQLFAKLAGCFDPETASAYEAIFTAWGGDVRERSVDLETGHVRPREIHVDPIAPKTQLKSSLVKASDPTIYARVDYLDANANITQAERDSCKTVLKNLPVIFTFAPMNLLHYRVTFPARSTQTLTVSYRQYAYKDTRDPAGYQLAYVLHPASMWKHFGPIHLEVAAPEGVPIRASVPCKAAGIEERKLEHPLFIGPGGNRTLPFAISRSVVTQKTGDLFVALNARAWDQRPAGLAQARPAQQRAMR